MNRRVAVIAAFACDPRLPSEPTIGWHFVNALATASETIDNCDVIAFMNQRSCDITMQNWIDKPPIEIVGVQLPSFLRFLLDPRLTRFEYLVWNIQVKNRLRKLAQSNQVVLAHHVTFASELLPTPISVLSNSTLKIWGPVGSSGNADVYRVSPRWGSWKFNYIVQKTRSFLSRRLAAINSRKINLVLTQSSELSRQLSNRNRDTRVFPNVIVDESLTIISDTSQTSELGPDSGHRTILCIGNLIYLKRFELAIAALASPELADARLIIIGKPGPGQENYLLPVATKFGVEQRVLFTGQIPRSQVIEHMRNTDVVFHPSAREGASGVVGEATTLGVPVVCFEQTGAAVVLQAAETSGFAVSALETDARSIARTLSAAMNLPRISTDLWTYQRFVDLEHELLESVVGKSNGY